MKESPYGLNQIHLTDDTNSGVEKQQRYCASETYSHISVGEVSRLSKQNLVKLNDRNTKKSIFTNKGRQTTPVSQKYNFESPYSVKKNEY